MRYIIKHKYFTKIKNGSKKKEYRDSHITLISDKTKELIQVDIIKAKVIKISDIPKDINRNMFSNKKIIEFTLK